jgi:uncharacterized protein
MTDDKRTILGRVATPVGQESTTGKFYFWVDKDQVVERTQIVSTKATVGTRPVTFIGLVQEVYRRSRQKDIGEESARFDGRTTEKPMFDSEGTTYAEVAILRTDPVAHTPPTEESAVYLATEEEAKQGYGVDKMKQPLPVGLLRNGGESFAGKAVIDQAFLLGESGGHLNVNGIAGVGTKSTLLLTVNWMLLREARIQRVLKPSGKRLQVVPVIFNVKNFDLFFIDRWNTEFREKETEYRADWRAMGVDDPAPFEKCRFFAPQAAGIDLPIPTGGKRTGVQAYSWSLKDIIELGLFPYLFSDDDINDANFGGLLQDIEEDFTEETPDGPKLKSNRPQTFRKMLDEFKDDLDGFGAGYEKSTKKKFLRKLKFIVKDSDGVLRMNDNNGHPLKIPNAEQDGPIVIDLYGLHASPNLQRFVVAAVFAQIQKTQSSKQAKDLKFLITLDELNRFAPRESSDPITTLLETIASEGRSQGIILLGAQQQASLVKPRVIENAAVRAIGRSGTLELSAEIWKFLGPTNRAAAAQLQQEEKLLFQPSFREPMLAKIPFPPFALSENNAAADSTTTAKANSSIPDAEW